MTAKLYTDFIKKHVEPWHKNKNSSFRKNMIFMPDIAPSRPAKVTTEFLPDMAKECEGQPALQI